MIYPDFTYKGVTYKVAIQEPVNGSPRAFYIQFTDENGTPLVSEAVNYVGDNSTKTIKVTAHQYYIHPNGKRINSPRDLSFIVDNLKGEYDYYASLENRSFEKDMKWVLNGVIARLTAQRDPKSNVISQIGWDVFSPNGDFRRPISFSLSSSDATQTGGVDNGDGSITVAIADQEPSFELEVSLTGDVTSPSDWTDIVGSSHTLSNLVSGDKTVYIKYKDALTTKFSETITVNLAP